MTTTGTFDATTTQLPAPLSVPEASHSIPSNTNTWTSWLYNLFTTSNSNQTPTTGTGRNLLEESDLNASWVAIPSQEDIIMATKTKFERMERLQELTSISDAARSLKKLAQSETTYTRLFGSPFLSHEELIACQNPLETNTRSAIISKLLHWYSGSYLKTLQRIYFSPENADASVSSWDIFADQFMETKYRKGVIGSMKDIAVLIYHGVVTNGLNGRILHQIVLRWIDILSKAFQDLTQREIKMEELELIQKVVSESIAGPLIRLHVDVAIKSVESYKRSGILPQMWADQDQEKLARLQELKRTGAVDARFEEHQRWTPNSDVDLADGGRKAAAAHLEKTLFFRAPAPSKPHLSKLPNKPF